MKALDNFLKGVDSILLPAPKRLRFPAKITPDYRPHFSEALNHLQQAYVSEVSRQEKIKVATKKPAKQAH